MMSFDFVLRQNITGCFFFFVVFVFFVHILKTTIQVKLTIIWGYGGLELCEMKTAVGV